MPVPPSHNLIKELHQKTLSVGADRRYLLGLVGPPGAGKSTVAQHLAAAVNRLSGAQVAAVVPMDGFHLRNAVLHRLQLHHLKGIPDTFDADGFIELIKQLRKTPPVQVLCPSFDRSLEEPEAGAIEVAPWHRLAVIEGNYLLLRRPPWDAVKPLLDEIWFLDVPEALLIPRLIERHMLAGRSKDAAVAKVEGTDLPNTQLIGETRQYADRVLRADAAGHFI